MLNTLRFEPLSWPSWRIPPPALRQASAAALAASAAMPCHAIENPLGRGTFQIAPYLYGMSIKGKLGFDGTSVDLDVKPQDIVGDINAGAMGYIRWVDEDQFFYGEGLGADFEDDSFDQFYGQHVKSSLLLTEVGYGRNFYAETVAPAPGMMTISPYIGVRYAQLTFEVPNPIRTLAEKETWLDPVLGLIIEAPLIGPINYALKIDGAGFGLGRDHYWSVTAAAHYTHTEHWSLVAGYRIARFNADPGGGNAVKMELRASGPEAGIVFSF